MKEGLDRRGYWGFIFEAGIVYYTCDFEDRVLWSLPSSLFEELAALCLLNITSVCMCQWVMRYKKKNGVEQKCGCQQEGMGHKGKGTLNLEWGGVGLSSNSAAHQLCSLKDLLTLKGTRFHDRSSRKESSCKVHLSSSDGSDNRGDWNQRAACSPLANKHPLW